MNQNNKTARVSSTRWLSIIEFLHENLELIKAGLADSIGPDQLRTDIFLQNTLSGDFRLIRKITLPDGDGNVLIYSLVRPPLKTAEELLRDIDALTLTDFLMLILRQLDVRPPGDGPLNESNGSTR